MDTNNQDTRFAAPAALIAGVVSIVSFVSLAFFFALEAPSIASSPDGFHFWGFISDITPALAMIALIVVMVAMHRVERSQAQTLSRIALMVGVIGAVGVIIFQLLLIFRFLTFEQEVGPVVLAMGLTGVWLVLSNYLALTQRILSPGLAWLGLVTGVAQSLYPLLLQVAGGPDFYTNLGSNIAVMALVSIVALISYIGFPIWAIWFARRWSTRPQAMKTGAAYAG